VRPLFFQEIITAENYISRAEFYLKIPWKLYKKFYLYPQVKNVFLGSRTNQESSDTPSGNLKKFFNLKSLIPRKFQWYGSSSFNITSNSIPVKSHIDSTIPLYICNSVHSDRSWLYTEWKHIGPVYIYICSYITFDSTIVI
jgi:hypothetical protein